MQRVVEEYGADPGTDRLFHEIRSALRFTGIRLIFRLWAAQKRFFPGLWRALRPNLETRAFEHGADRLRAEAVESAARLGSMRVRPDTSLGASQRFQLRRSIDAYHYSDPKLLVLLAAVALSLRGEGIGGREISREDRERIERGAPVGMAPLEVVPAGRGERESLRILGDCRRTLGFTPADGPFHALALWPEYLKAAWRDLRPTATAPPFRAAADELRDRARELARGLPYPLLLPPHSGSLRKEADAILEATRSFEAALPVSILLVSLLKLDRQTVEEASLSPYPALLREVAAGQEGLE